MFKYYFAQQRVLGLSCPSPTYPPPSPIGTHDVSPLVCMFCSSQEEGQATFMTGVDARVAIRFCCDRLSLVIFGVPRRRNTDGCENPVGGYL